MAQNYATKYASKVDEAFKDFFSDNNIEFSNIKHQPFSAFYKKKDEWNRYNYRGVTVIEDGGAHKPVLYFGRRNENSAIHRKDAILCLGDDEVILRDESLSRYDEIPLYGSGTHAEFEFS